MTTNLGAIKRRVNFWWMMYIVGYYYRTPGWKVDSVEDPLGSGRFYGENIVSKRKTWLVRQGVTNDRAFDALLEGLAKNDYAKIDDGARSLYPWVKGASAYTPKITLPKWRRRGVVYKSPCQVLERAIMAWDKCVYIDKDWGDQEAAPPHWYSMDWTHLKPCAAHISYTTMIVDLPTGESILGLKHYCLPLPRLQCPATPPLGERRPWNKDKDRPWRPGDHIIWLKDGTEATITKVTDIKTDSTPQQQLIEWWFA